MLTSGANLAFMDIDFANDRAWLSPNEVTIASLLSSSRAASKVYTNAAGVLSSVGSNTLANGDVGLLAEGAVTNLLPFSEALDNAAWTKTNVTISANAIAAPDGTTTADKIAETTAVGLHFANRASVISTSASTVYTASAYVRPAERTWINFSDSTATNVGAWFNLSGSGSVGTRQANNLTATITALADSWYRITYTFTSTGSGSRPTFYTATADNTVSHTGVTGNGFHAWGVQLQLGSFATSYIPTPSTVAVTSAADIITFSDLTWLDGAHDSIYVEWIARDVNNATILAIDGTNNVLLSEQIGMSARIANATVANVVAAGSAVSIAAHMALNDYVISMNGGAIATDAVEAAIGTMSAARIGSDLAGINPANTLIKRIAVFKGVLL